MKCHIINKTDTKDLSIYYPAIRYYFNKTFKKLKIAGNYEISLILVDEKEIQRINREYRKIDKVTDVISFAEIDDENSFDCLEDEDIYLGDIFINVKRVYSQAKDYGHSFKREFVFLFIHGVLHCLGYDHIEKDDEVKMIEAQKLIVGDLK